MAKENGIRANAKSIFILTELRKKGVLGPSTDKKALRDKTNCADLDLSQTTGFEGGAKQSLQKRKKKRKVVKNQSGEVEDASVNSQKEGKARAKRRKNGMSEAVLATIKCPICWCTMRGHIHQVFVVDVIAILPSVSTFSEHSNIHSQNHNTTHT